MKSDGQYDSEYKKTNAFWGWEPAKYVKLAKQYIEDQHKTVLDIGAGEGKNSFYLAKMGLDVTAVEVSIYAVKNFIDKMIEFVESGNILDVNIVYADGKEWMNTCPNYDIIVSYGMLHCLPSYNDIKIMIEQYKDKTNTNGLNIICTFVKGEPVPEVQKYLEPCFVDAQEIISLYSNWDILSHEIDVIEHSHTTSQEIHKHTVLRMLTRKK